MSNYTILELNTMAGFEFNDTKELYLRGSQKDELKAFWMAHKWERYLRNIGGLIEFAASQHCGNPHVNKPAKGITDEVLEFIKNRHYYSYFPQQ